MHCILEVSIINYSLPAIFGLLAHQPTLHMQVADVKAQIEETQGADFPKDSMNIIHQGKVLKDEATVKESNISETGFCVVMIMKVCFEMLCF